VSARRDGEAVAIDVSDTGIGIAPAFLPFVFDRFRQQDAANTREYGGLGLGLAIVRHLAELHGGTVTASSGGEGAGATFTVRVPVRQPVAAV
jgi:signal transduction histidine kinase